MSIEIKCSNCANYYDEYDDNWCNLHDCKKEEVNAEESCFAPKEELVRQDERKKFITLLKSDLENYDGLADEFYESNCVSHMDDMIECIAISKYIKSTIELLEKEQ